MSLFSDAARLPADAAEALKEALKEDVADVRATADRAPSVPIASPARRHARPRCDRPELKIV